MVGITDCHELVIILKAHPESDGNYRMSHSYESVNLALRVYLTLFQTEVTLQKVN